MLWLTTLAAVLTAWWVDHCRLAFQINEEEVTTGTTVSLPEFVVLQRHILTVGGLDFGFIDHLRRDSGEWLGTSFHCGRFELQSLPFTAEQGFFFLCLILALLIVALVGFTMHRKKKKSNLVRPCSALQ